MLYLSSNGNKKPRRLIVCICCDYFQVSRFVDETILDLDETADETILQGPGKSSRQFSIYDLKNWYGSKKGSPVVIIVLEDIDMFPETVIKDLLLLLR